MSILIYIETVDNAINKGGLEMATYGKKTAEVFGTESHALVIGDCTNIDSLKSYGITKIHHCTDSNLEHFDSQTYTSAISATADACGANTVLIRHSSLGKTLIGMLAIKLNAGSVSGANSLPSTNGGFSVKKGVYSGKAIVEYTISSPKRVLSVMGNSIQPDNVGGDTPIEPIVLNVASGKSKVIERKTVSGIVPLPEAELVVSAGRGMKGPENWGIIEELADVLGATTACSRPVADTGWRPHHEHVGQTGVAIRPNLYIAAGISGAIQHLAGVNNSKTIVVINKDADAPFFKAADYGIVGDLFEVVPRLTEALKKFKANN